jgi:hypothetical protein
VPMPYFAAVSSIASNSLLVSASHSSCSSTNSFSSLRDIRSTSAYQAVVASPNPGAKLVRVVVESQKAAPGAKRICEGSWQSRKYLIAHDRFGDRVAALRGRVGGITDLGQIAPRRLLRGRYRFFIIEERTPI